MKIAIFEASSAKGLATQMLEVLKQGTKVHFMTQSESAAPEGSKLPHITLTMLYDD